MITSKLKQKNNTSFSRRKRRSSLKNLLLVDDLKRIQNTNKKINDGLDSVSIFNSSQTELFPISNISDSKDGVSTVSNCKFKLKPNDIQNKSAMLGFDDTERDYWAEHDFMSDCTLLEYATPLKSLVTNGDQNEKSNCVDISKDFQKTPNNSFHESWFEDVDLSMLEKECTVKDKTNFDINTVSSPDHKISSDTISPKKRLTISNAEKVIESTPKSNNTKSNFKTRLRKTLAENARKTPQLQNTVLKSSNNINSQDLTNKIKSLLDANDLSTQDIGPFFGLPSTVKKLLEKLRGISSLYDWQKDCLTREEIKAGKNLVYTLPTSGGKTLVAEILIMKTLLCLKKNAILVLPFVAIVQEKIESLSQFAVELGFLIEEYAGVKGRFPPRKRRKKNVLYVCTIEKSNSLVNSLIETNRLDEIKLIVVDELHMIGEGGRRGATIEAMIAKALYLSLSAPMQIIGMSATLSNSDELASFLRANVYCNDFRPVQLNEYIKVTDCVYKVDPSNLDIDEKLIKERTLSQPTSGHVVDTDHLSSLVLEVVPDHSCLIFCPTKRNCENVALFICKFLPKKLMEHQCKGKHEILKALKRDSGNVCPTLWKIIPFGVAYHHSGLTSDEKRIIEDGYRSGVLSTITCTSTLAAGVNLPARRVIIRSPHIGQGLMSRAQYKQMIGRAGRAGIDSKGESYLIVSKENQSQIEDLVCGPLESCTSSLLFDNGKGFRSLLLSLISLKIISRRSEAINFFNQTLCSKQLKTMKNNYPDLFQETCGDEVESNCDVMSSRLVESSFQYLLNLKLIEEVQTSEETSFKPTVLGKATSKCGIDFDITSKLFDDLNRGLESLVLENYLHLLYMVTPYESSTGINPNWLIYMSEINRLSSAELAAASVIGVPEQYIVRRASGNNPKKKKLDQQVINRFYVTLMLYELFKGKSVWDVAARFEMPRGFLQTLLTSSASFASCVLRFSQEFESFWPYQALLEKLMEVLQYCRITELVPLMEISSVRLARAKQLYKAGYKSLAQVAAADTNALVESIDLLTIRQARQIISSAKVLLAEKIDSLQEEMELLKSADI